MKPHFRWIWWNCKRKCVCSLLFIHCIFNSIWGLRVCTY